MMTRTFVVTLLGVALLCGFVAGQDEASPAEAAPSDDSAADSPPPKTVQNDSVTTESATEPAAEPEPEPESEPEPEPEGEEETKAKSEASFSSEDQNGAALVSVSLPSLVLAAVLAKVYAH